MIALYLFMLNYEINTNTRNLSQNDSLYICSAITFEALRNMLRHEKAVFTCFKSLYNTLYNMLCQEIGTSTRF